jgi:hypothetical protein
VNLHEALQDVEIAFRQLEFSIKFLTFCELKKLDPSEFDTDLLVKLEEGNLNFPTGHFSDPDNIIRAAKVSVALAFGASALALDKAFETAQIPPDPESDTNVARIRTLIYMVRCAYAHGIAEPRWEVHGKYRRAMSVELEGIVTHLDLEKLDGNVFDFEHIGGHSNWNRMRDAAMHVLRATSQRDAAGGPSDPATDRER